MIYRGTTPTHIFSFPFDSDDVDSLYISYAQKGRVIVEKTIDDVEYNAQEETISTTLSQEDTLAFEGCGARFKTIDSTVFIQIRVLFTNGEAWASEIMKDRVVDLLKDGKLYATSTAV